MQLHAAPLTLDLTTAPMSQVPNKEAPFAERKVDVASAHSSHPDRRLDYSLANLSVNFISVVQTLSTPKLCTNLNARL
jgi:hypothetical protein